MELRRSQPMGFDGLLRVMGAGALPAGAQALDAAAPLAKGRPERARFAAWPTRGPRSHAAAPVLKRATLVPGGLADASCATRSTAG